VLLRERTLLLRAAVSDGADIVARYGGDEFRVVFADAETSSAIESAERLRGAAVSDITRFLVAAQARRAYVNRAKRGS
jgi:diguanylate cyclase (GGDEF)-like protein